MTVLMSHNPIAKEIVDIFGIEDCVDFKFSMTVGQIAVVEVKFLVKEEQARELVPIFKKYKLVELTEDELVELGKDNK